MRPGQRGAAAAAPGGAVVVSSLVAGFVLLSLSGCAVFGHRNKSAEGVAAGRELSRQGVAALEMGQSQQAEELLKKALLTSPDDASTHRYMAEALWRRGARPEALSQITESVRLEPTNASLAVRAGEFSLSCGMRESALGNAERAIRIDPSLSSAWTLRGRCFQQMNQPDRALADMERALELGPDSSDVILEVAGIYRQRGQHTRCLTAIHHLLDTCPSGEEPQSALVMQGLTLMDLGRPQQATDAFVAAVRRGPPSADLCYYLAQSYSACGHISEATEAAQQALAINAAHEPSRHLLAQMASRPDPDSKQRR